MRKGKGKGRSRSRSRSRSENKGKCKFKGKRGSVARKRKGPFPGHARRMLDEAIAEVASMRERCARDPERDFTRSRVLTLEVMLRMVVTWGKDSLGPEVMDALGWRDGDAPTVSAVIQAWEKLSDEALPLLLGALLRRFDTVPYLGRFRLLAADGTGIPLLPTRDPRTRITSNQSGAGRNEAHPTCSYDVLRRTFEGMVWQGSKEQNEQAALCELVDSTYPGRSPEGVALRALWIADRGYCGFNVLCHLLEAGASFVVRASDEWVRNLLRDELPEGEFDVDVERILTVTRSERHRTRPDEPQLYRRVSSPQRLDVLPRGSFGEYPVRLRVIRVAIPSDDADPNKCGDRWPDLVTDLPRDEYPVEVIVQTYRYRWSEEIGFPRPRHTVGLDWPRTRDFGRACQEVYGRLVLYDACSLGTSRVPKPKPGPKYERAVDASVALKAMLRLIRGRDADVEDIALKYTHPMREGRDNPRRERTQRAPSPSRRG